jgi:parvulin-like peptidyl-prolyl isomerase
MQRQHPQKPIKKRAPRQTKTGAASAQNKVKSSKFRLVLTIAAIVLFLVIVAGTAYYMVAVQPFQRVILSVGNENIKTEYFLKRIVASQGMTADTVLQSLIVERVITQQAVSMGFPAPTSAEIDDYLRNIARGENETISDTNYDIWLQEQQDNTGLTIEEFRDIAASEFQAQQIQDFIGSNVNTQVPQVYLWVIILGDQEAATAAKARIDGGESFQTVAQEVSTDTTTKDKGGDLGWQVTELLSSQITSTLETLDIGKCSDPVTFTQQDNTSGAVSTSYLLLMVSEKSVAMQVDETQLSQLKYKAFLDWINEQEAKTEIVVHGLNGSDTLDEQTTAWIDYQVTKLVKKLAASSSSESSTDTSTP